MAIIKKFSSYQNLTNVQTAYVDTNPNSDYFRITEFNETFTGGKNGFLIEGSPLLKESTEVKIEILDVEGNPVYYEPGDGIPEYYEGLSKLVSVHIYDDTPIGLGKITILGEAKQFIDNNGIIQNVPESEQGFYNVKWERTFQINKNLNNEDIVRFYKRPQIQITELVKPIFSKSIPSVTDTVEVTGVPETPPFDTDLTNWRAGTFYKLIRTTGSWDRDVDENTITTTIGNIHIQSISNTQPIRVITPYNHNFSDTNQVTFSDIVGFTQLNGQTKFIKKINNTTFDLYDNISLTSGSNGTTGSVYISDGFATSGTSTYSPTIIEVLNDREVLVDIPYTENNLVKSFISQSASVTYSDFQNEIIGESALTGSFAKIDMSQLKTFVGDVARVKIFRKSRNTAGDFQFVQESKLESTELLRDVTTQSDNEISYGNFTETNLDTYWVISSIDHPTSVDSSVLSQAVKVDYDSSSGGIQKLITSEEFSLSKDVEYTLSFKALLSGSISSTKYINAYFSGSYTNSLDNESSYTQSFMYISGSDVYKTRQNVSQNILAERDINAKLVFEFKGDDWYVSNVSLRNAQETSFSPDEFTLIQDIPRKLASETFDFRFEFYDINNNYIPVDVVASATFDGGNDFPTSGKLLTFESDRNAFRFSTGSIANPPNQTIQFKTTFQNLTGSILFTSQAFDVAGNPISSQSYYESGSAVYGTPFTGSYPGLLTGVTTAGALISISNFSGSLDVDTIPSESIIRVGSIIYTASMENGSVQEFETVYRLEDGDNAPQLIVTSNANQFVYEPTALEPKPSGQEIRVRAQRKNLASLEYPITITSGSNAPLTYVDTVNGIDTYTISATDFSSSFASSSFDEITYSFSCPDVFGNIQTDEITLSKVVNFDGVSITLSNEHTAFRANSVGKVLDSFREGDGVVELYIGDKEIEHDNGLNNPNRFDIVSATPINVDEQYPNYLTNEYGISALNEDSGSLILTITYLAGDDSTTQSFRKKVNYTKNRIGAPTITIETTNKNQNVDAKSTGEQITPFEDSIFTINEFYTGSNSTKSIVGSLVFDQNPNNIASQLGTSGIQYNNLSDSSNSEQVIFTATVEDSEGSSRTITDTISLSKTKNAPPSVTISATPQSQNVKATTAGVQTGTLSDVTVSALIGNVEALNVSLTITGGSSAFDSTPTINGNVLELSSRTLIDDEATVTLDVSYTDIEGEDGSQSIAIRAIKSNDGNDGAPGSSGVVINVTPTSQIVKVATNGTYATPSIFTVTVTENGNLLTHTTNSTLANNQFKIEGLSLGVISAGSGTTTPDIQPSTPSTVTGLTTSFTVTYKDSQGNESTAIPQSHKVSVVLDGVTGPGVVHTGVWESGRLYQFDNGLLTGTGRRDTVLWSTTGSPPYDTYYACDASHLSVSTNSSNGAPHQPNSTRWTSLGTQDFFVAAKIGVFEESFIQNTLNIGSNNSGGFSSANITLYGGSANPYFSLGQSTAGVYGANGIFIGNDGGNYRASFVNGTNSFLKWNGSTLEIKGSISFTNSPNISTFTNDSGFTDDTAANAAQQTADNAQSDASEALTRPKVFRQTSAPSTSNPNGSLWYDTDADNKLYILIGSTWTLTRDGGITDAIADAAAAQTLAGGVSDNLQDLIDGQAILGGGTFINGDIVYSPVIAGANGYISNIFKVGNGGITLDGPNKKIFTGTGTFGNSNTPFYVDNASRFSLGNKVTWNGSSLSVTGNITADTLTANTAGTIAGWNINSNSLTGGSGGTTIGLVPGSGIHLGNSSFGSSPFRVTNAGVLVAESANITGTINAEEGFIGDWEISSGNLVSNEMEINAGANTISISNGDLVLRPGFLTSTNTANVNIGIPAIPSQTKITWSPTQNPGRTEFNLATGTFYVSEPGNYRGSIDDGDAYDVTNFLYQASSQTPQGFLGVNIYVEVKDPSGGLVGIYGIATTSYGFGASFPVPLETTGFNNLYVFPVAGTYSVRVYLESNNFLGSGDAISTANSWANWPNENIGLVKIVQFTEITEVGMQVVQSEESFVRMDTNSTYVLQAEGSIIVDASGNPSFPIIYLRGTLHPNNGGLYDLGTSGNRWRTLYATNAVNTSDVRFKNSITGSDLGLDFIKKLNPVKYKWNDSKTPRYHYGFIAQEMTASLAEFGHTSDTVGFIYSSSVSDEFRDEYEEILNSSQSRDDFETLQSEISAAERQELMLSYNELLSPMVKAIQELTSKVEELEYKLSASLEQ